MTGLAAVAVVLVRAVRVQERCVCACCATGLAAVVVVLVRAVRVQERCVCACCATGLAAVALVPLVCAGRVQLRWLWACWTCVLCASVCCKCG